MSKPTLIPKKHTQHIFNGVLWIGDPHIWSKRPGRRLDESFLTTVLNKIKAAAVIANEQNLFPVFGGDLFHKSDDYEPDFLVQVVEALQSFDHTPLTITGNHEKEEWVLTKQDALYLLQTTGQIDVIDKNDLWGTIKIQSKMDQRVREVAIGGTPYGQKPPLDVSDILNISLSKQDQTIQEYHKRIQKEIAVDFVIWLTHEDFEFENSYPGAKTFQSILGADIVINGHMHGRKKPFSIEPTVYYNPGNITRMSVDMADHIPAVWEWNLDLEETTSTSQGLQVPALVEHRLASSNGSEIFNMEGYHAKKSLYVDHINAEHSRFVTLLKQEKRQDKSDDATGIQLTLQDYYSENPVNDDVKLWMEVLLARGLQKQKSL